MDVYKKVNEICHVSTWFYECYKFKINTVPQCVNKNVYKLASAENQSLSSLNPNPIEKLPQLANRGLITIFFFKDEKFICSLTVCFLIFFIFGMYL